MTKSYFNFKSVSLFYEYIYTKLSTWSKYNRFSSEWSKLLTWIHKTIIFLVFVRMFCPWRSLCFVTPFLKDFAHSKWRRSNWFPFGFMSSQVVQVLWFVKGGLQIFKLIWDPMSRAIFSSFIYRWRSLHAEVTSPPPTKLNPFLISPRPP